MRSPFVPRAGSFSVGMAGRPRSDQLGALAAPWSMLMKMARLAPSLSWRSWGTTEGLKAQKARFHEAGRSFDHMVATSLKLTWPAVARAVPPALPPVAMVAEAPRMPWGLPEPEPWKKA